MKTILPKSPLALTLPLVVASVCVLTPAHAALPLLPEQIAVTCFSGTLNYNTSQVFPNSTPNGFVVAIFDTRTGTIGPLIPSPASPPYVWNGLSAPPFAGFHNEPGQRWNSANLGEVFGIAVDDLTPPNIYVTATDCYNAVLAPNRLPAGPGGRGGVYRLDATTGAISSGSLPNDPNQGPGLGNVCFRRAGNGTGYLYVSDFENGMIYRMNAATLVTVGSPFDHGVQGRPNESLAPIADNATVGMTQYGRRVWGVKTYQNRLFYGVWWEDSRNVNAGESNEVWSVDLDNNGDFIAPTTRRRIKLPNYPDPSIGLWSHPVASIDFSQSGKMFLAERYFQFLPPAPNASFGSHHDRVHRYWLSGSTWITDPAPTHHIGGAVSFYFPNNGQVGGSAAGGVAVNCDESIWATGDMFAGSYSTPPNWIGGPGDLGAVYGAMRIPSGGNSALPGYGYGGFAIDFDGQTNAYTDVAKFAVGAVATVRSCCVPPPSGLAAWWPLDELTGATVFADLSPNGNNALIQAGALGSAQSPLASSGKVAGGANFIDSNTRGRAPNSASLNFGTGSFTVDCWIRPILSGAPAWKTVVDKFDPAGIRGYAVGISNGNVVLRVGDGTSYTHTGPSVTYSAWNFIAVTVNRTANTVTFHINGVSGVPQPLVPSGSFNNTIDLLIGAPNAPNFVSETVLDEIELFNRALATNEISAIWIADSNGKCKTPQPPGCSSSIVTIICPPNTNVACAPVIYYPGPKVFTSCGTITNVVCTPPSGSPFPPGTTIVTCVAIDSQGHSNSCTFTVTSTPDVTPPVIDCMCLANSAHELLQTVACKGTVPTLCQFYPCFSDNCCLRACSQTPAPGTIVGPGITPITVTLTDCAGNQSSCTLNYIVTPPSTGCETPCLYCPPDITVTGCPPRTPDYSTYPFAGSNCVPAGPLTVMQVPFAGTPLPPGTSAVTIQVCDALGNCKLCSVKVTAVPTGGNPVIVCPPNQVLQTCSNSAIGYYKVKASGYNGPIVCNPPSGFPFPIGTTVVTCSVTNNCGGMATCSFTITVRSPLTRWPCAWYSGIGIPFDLIGGSTMALRPEPDEAGGSDGTTTLAVGPIKPAVCIFPNPNSPLTPSGVLMHPGVAKAIRFSTVLNFGVPENVVLDLVLPPSTVNSTPIPLLSFRSKGAKGYCVKSSTKLYDDEPQQSYRSIAIGTNGQLFSSFAWDAANAQTNILLNLNYQPGVTSVLVTVELDLTTREVSLEFPHCIWTPDNARKGWDGCIYGNSPPSKGTKSGRLILTPTPPHNPHPPVTDVALRATAIPELLIEDANITTSGRKWGDGHVTLMKAYDDGESGLEFVALGSGGGVHVDLGHSESFDMRLTHFETGDVPTQEQLLTRTIGPIALTNRPSPPPFLDALLFQASPSGVECSADFSNIESPTVLVQIYNAGALVAERAGVPAQLGQPLFTLPSWPNRLAKLGGATPCRRGKIPPGFITLPGGPGLPPQDVMGDEFRVLAQLAPGAAHPDYYSSFEFVASAGSDWGITALNRVSICVPQPIAISGTAGGVTLTWSGDNFRLQGAENVTGPWYDLGVQSPAEMPSDSPARFLRLYCD